MYSRIDFLLQYSYDNACMLLHSKGCLASRTRMITMPKFLSIGHIFSALDIFETFCKIYEKR